MVESAHTTQVNGGAKETDGRVADANGKVAAVQPNARKFKMPAPVTYKDKDDEVRGKKEILAAAYRIFAAQGYDEGVAGHITLRDPKGRGFWVIAFGTAFDLCTPEDLLLIDGEGNVLEGGRDHQIYNAAGFAIHHAIHSARHDIECAAHSHSMYGKAFSTLRRVPRMLTQDSCALYNNIAIYAQFGGVVLDDAEGCAIVDALGDKKTVILANHGILTTGASIESAVSRFIQLESACQVEILASSAGAGLGSEPVTVGDEEAEYTAQMTGSEGSAYFWSRPYFLRDAAKQKAKGL